MILPIFSDYSFNHVYDVVLDIVSSVCSYQHRKWKNINKASGTAVNARRLVSPRSWVQIRPFPQRNARMGVNKLENSLQGFILHSVSQKLHVYDIIRVIIDIVPASANAPPS